MSPTALNAAPYEPCTKAAPYPGCSARWELVDIHHVTWYRHQGRSDIDNLLPLCHKHHHLVHEGGWKLALNTNRHLTITYPDGQTMTTGPPTRKAARTGDQRPARISRTGAKPSGSRTT